MYTDENEVQHPEHGVISGVNLAFDYDGLTYSESVTDLLGNPITSFPDPEFADEDEDLIRLLASCGL